MATPTPETRVALAQSLALIRDHVAKAHPGANLDRLRYRLVYEAVLNGSIPAERDGGRWFLRHADLPAIVEGLGLKPAARSKPTRKAVSPSNQAAAA